MSREETKMMQGVAILLMMYLHLFNRMSNVDLCYTFLYIGDMPLLHILSRATSPVPFFLIFSGYGLYIVESQRKDYNIFRKIGRLYIHYWISLLIFISIGSCLLGTSRYLGSWKDIILNITAWHTTWNEEIWFFFPYILLALSSKLLFSLMDRMKIWLFMVGALSITLLAQFIVSRYGAVYLYSHWLPYMPIMYLGCLFAFVAGAWMAKYQIVEKFIFKDYKCWLLLLILVALRCCLRTSAFHSLYAIAFIVLFVNAPRPKVMESFLNEMGRRSTSIWFVHSYFCYYLFHDFIYGMKYPMLIFLVLLGCSYTSALIVDWMKCKISI